MNTLEKLCRAACEADGINPDTVPRNLAYGGGAAWEFYRPNVEAVLSALEDPSDEMVEVGIKQLEECTFDWTSAAPCGAGHAFTAMIRKAKEG